MQIPRDNAFQTVNMVDDSSILFKTLYEMGTIRGCERISIKVGEYADVFKGAMEEGAGGGGGGGSHSLL